MGVAGMVGHRPVGMVVGAVALARVGVVQMNWLLRTDCKFKFKLKGVAPADNNRVIGTNVLI